MNLAGVIRGAGANDRFSTTVLHVGPDSWYINMGTPTNPNGLKISIPGIENSSLVTIQSYINVGTDIPPMPPLPANVAFMTGADNFMTNESLRATGQGLAFGASFNIGTGDLDFLAFYANFQLGAGFDVMLQNYGDAICAETNEPIGINGWYASGQAYAYVQGDIGIKVKLFGSDKKLKILTIGAAAALQTKLPNPFWARGAVGGYYSVLGGLVKGNCNFQMEIGESCTILGADDPVENMDVILQITPVDGADISVYTEPIVQFNVPIDTDFQLSGLNGNPQNYRAGVKSVSCTTGTGTPIQGTFEYNFDRTMLSFRPFDMFPANDSVLFSITANIEQNGSEIKEETWEVKFYTGDALDNIPESNIAASYPIKGQYNFHKEEWSQEKGYIILKTGQPDLFYNVPDGYTQRIQILNGGENVLAVEPTYDAYTKEISFPLPSFILENGLPYEIRLVNFAPNNAPATPVATNTSDGKPGDLLGGSSNTSNSTTTTAGIFTPSTSSMNNSASNSTPPGDTETDQILYKLHFRVSEFNTFRDKMDDFVANATFDLEGYGGETMTINYQTEEPFDVFETGNSPLYDALISCEALPVNNAWYAELENVLYQYFPGTIEVPTSLFSVNTSIKERPLDMGDPIPYNTMGLRSDDIVETNPLFPAVGVIPLQSQVNSTATFLYGVPGAVRGDRRDCKNQIDEEMMTGSYGVVTGNIPPGDDLNPEPFPEWFNFLKSNETLPNPGPGAYPVQVRYQLPGKATYTTTKQLNFVK